MRYRECSLLFGLVFAALLAAARPSIHAHELQIQPTPFSVWLDFEKLSGPNPQKVSLPIWMESVLSHSVPAQDGVPEQTAFRIRLRRMAHLNSEIQLRVFFQDMEGRAPMVTGWTETGSLR